jgi:uncharacterized protein (DUF2384 family)
MRKNPNFSTSHLKHELGVFFNNDTVMLKAWLNTPIPALSDQCPCNFLITKEQRKVLYELLQQMKFGEIA